MGVGAQMVRPGDQVYVLLGGRLPFVLRPRRDDWILIGETYVHHENIWRGREVLDVRSSLGKFRIKTLRPR